MGLLLSIPVGGVNGLGHFTFEKCMRALRVDSTPSASQLGARMVGMHFL